MRKLEGIVGKSKMNNRGDFMSIIRYGNSSDIDVKFDCGTVVKNRSYREFKKGTLSKPIGRVGETSVTKTTGHKMTIIAYRKACDIDVVFEDGTIIHGTNYRRFTQGQIRKPENRLGKKFTNNQGVSGRIISYRSATDIDIEFSSGSIVENLTYANVMRGNVLDPLEPSVFGVGFLGVGIYSRKNNTLCHTKWASIIRRCYYEGYHANQKCYKDVTVCEEWHSFQNFAKWFEENYDPKTMRGWHLDKDLLSEGSKIYSPETCCFVPQEINKFFAVQQKKRNLPVRVYKQANKYKTNLNVENKSRSFDTLEEAVSHYNTTKNRQGVTLAKKWGNKISDTIYSKLINYKLKY